MNKYEEEEIAELEKKILSELNKLERCRSKEERISKTNILFNINKILENYDALEPTLRRFFNDRQIRMKWEGKER